MRSQKVSVDVWKMFTSSCSYLVLAVLAWIFLRLVNACFYLPRHLKEQEKRKAKERESQAIVLDDNIENKKEL